jgi:ATP-binding protein involved in chromosome partitioning
VSARPSLADAVRAVVGLVPDPELHRPLAELDMVREVRAGRRGQVSIRIALTTPGCPMTGQIRAEVTRAATAVEGVGAVTVEFGVMPESQRAAISAPSGTSPARVVYAVASGKGGVGKSTVAANLAVALAASSTPTSGATRCRSCSGSAARRWR